MTDSQEAFVALMDATGFKYELDDDGDARVSFSMDHRHADRSQMVWVRGSSDSYGDHVDRDVCSYIAKVSDLPKDFDVLAKLLEYTARKKMGGLVIMHGRLTYRADASAAAGPEGLRSAILFVADVADELEAAITGGDAH
jgi:hypothetical protein